jgi:hypothetical protein
MSDLGLTRWTKRLLLSNPEMKPMHGAFTESAMDGAVNARLRAAALLEQQREIRQSEAQRRYKLNAPVDMRGRPKGKKNKKGRKP